MSLSFRQYIYKYLSLLSKPFVNLFEGKFFNGKLSNCSWLIGLRLALAQNQKKGFSVPFPFLLCQNLYVSLKKVFMWLFQCFPLFTYQIYLKSMFSKLGKRMCFIQGDTKSTFSSLFLLFSCTGQCFQQVEKKDTSGFPWRTTCWILYVTLHHCLCTQNSANFRKQHFGIIFLTGHVQIRK